MHTQMSCSDDLNLNGFKILRENVLFKENLNNIILLLLERCVHIVKCT